MTEKKSKKKDGRLQKGQKQGLQNQRVKKYKKEQQDKKEKKTKKVLDSKLYQNYSSTDNVKK